MNEPPTRAAPPSPKLAFIVVAIALVVLIFGGVASVVTSGGGTTTTTTALPSMKLPSGNTVGQTAGTKALARVEAGGDPPSDILSDLTVPAGATPDSVSDDDSASGYDRSELFTVALSQGDVIAFMEDALHAGGWTVLSEGPERSGAGIEILAKHGSEDGYYWEAATDVLPTTFATPATGAAGSPTAQHTSFSIELYEVSDDD